LVSHQFYLSTGKDDTIERSASEIVTVGNIDSVQGDILNRFDYAALGHIHKAQRLNGKDCYRYCGTPIACSFGEEGQLKGVIEVELKEKGEVVTTVLPLEPLRQVRTIKDTLENVLAQASEDYVSITLTDADDYLAVDVRDQLEACFPHLLHVGREAQEEADYQLVQEKAVQLSPFALCRDFLQDLDADEEQLLASIINEVQEAEK
jgi:exonuclease SbcD